MAEAQQFLYYRELMKETQDKFKYIEEEKKEVITELKAPTDSANQQFLEQRLTALEQQLAAVEQQLAAVEQMELLSMQLRAGGPAGEQGTDQPHVWTQLSHKLASQLHVWSPFGARTEETEARKWSALC